MTSLPLPFSQASTNDVPADGTSLSSPAMFEAGSISIGSDGCGGSATLATDFCLCECHETHERL